MAVIPRGKSFQADFHVGRQRVRRSFGNEAEASKFEADTLARAQLGLSLASPAGAGLAEAPVTLGQLFDWVQETVWSKQKSAASSECNCRKVLEVLGHDLAIASITTAHVDALVRSLGERKCEGSTVNRKLAVLSKALREAHERGWITRLPRFSRCKESRGRIRYLSLSEEADALKALDFLGDTEFKDLFVLLIDTGMRRGEALALESRDTDLKHKAIRVWLNKADLPRSVPMTDRVLEVCKRRAAADGGKIFSYTPAQLEHRWDRLQGLLKLTHDRQFVPHCLRHTCASRLVQAGVEITVVKEWLGHKTIGITMRYAHLAPKQLFNAARSLEQFQLTGHNIQPAAVA